MMTNCIICKKAANDLTFHDKSHPYFKLVLTKVLRKHGKIPRLRELLTCHKCFKKLTKNVKPQNEQNSLSFLLDTPELLLQNTPQSQPELLLLNSQSQQSQPTVQQSASQIASSEELGQNMAPDDAASESVSINFNSNSLETNVLPPNFEDSINSSSSSEHLSIVIEEINQNRSHSNSAAPRRVQIVDPAGTAGRNFRQVKKNLGG